MGLAQVNVVPPNPLPPELPSGEAEQEGVETLTRGPIHEAFANPAEPDPEPNRLVPKQPPADVPEQPAAYRPEGDYEWIPGYWEWDDDRDEFLWVTGVWRQPPPNMRWVPGYWNQVEGGWQRVEGFWVGDEVENVTYYEQPPATIESGPSSPAPADNYFWIPARGTMEIPDMRGKAATGRRISKTGCGFRRGGSGRPRDLSICRATGTIAWATADRFLRRGVSHNRLYAARVFLSPDRGDSDG